MTIVFRKTPYFILNFKKIFVRYLEIFCIVFFLTPKFIFTINLHLSGKIRIAVFFNNKVFGFPKTSIMSKDIINYKSRFPFHIEISAATMKKFPCSKSNFTRIFSTKTQHLVLNDVAGNKFGGLVWNNTWIHAPYICHFKMTNGTIIKEFDEAIYLSNNFMGMYAHWFFDLLAPFIILPEDVKRNCILVTGCTSKFLAEVYCALGYDIKNLYQITSDNDFVLMHKMHILISGDQVNSHTGITFQKLRAVLKKALNFDLRAPNRYILYNRTPKQIRHYTNFNELCSSIIKCFDQYPWEKIETITEGLNNTVLFWNSVKLLYASSGSTFANCIFMQNHTAACIHLADWFDSPALWTCLSYGVMVFASLATNCIHFHSKNCIASIQESIASISRALICLAKLNGTENLSFNLAKYNITDFNYTIFREA